MTGNMPGLNPRTWHPARNALDTALARPAAKAAAQRMVEVPNPRVIPRLGRIAQLVEQLTLNQRVQGSSPCAPTNPFKGLGHARLFIPTKRSAVIPTKLLHLTPVIAGSLAIASSRESVHPA